MGNLGNLGNDLFLYVERRRTLENLVKANFGAFVYLLCQVDSEEEKALNLERRGLISACYAATMAALTYYRKILNPAVFAEGLTQIIDVLTIDDQEDEKPITYRTLLKAALANAGQKEQSLPNS